MSVLFLMEGAQKTDRAFGLTPQSTSHMVHSPHEHIDKMAKHICEACVTEVVEGPHHLSLIQQGRVGRNCPQQAGSITHCKGMWLTMRMTYVKIEEIDLNYELFDVL